MPAPLSLPLTPRPLFAGLCGRCPRCGVGRLFVGSVLGLTLVETCDACGFDTAAADTGDGPAVFAIMILGFLMLGMALVVEFSLAPPLWVHVIVFAPLTLFVAIGLLRPLKGLLIALQYRNSAGHGRADRHPGGPGDGPVGS